VSGVTVSKYGLLFVWECFKTYLGASWPVFAVFAAGILISAVCSLRHRGSRKGGQWPVTKLFLVLGIMLLITLYNPVIIEKLAPKLGMTTVFYRAFWVLPVIFGAAYYLTVLTCAVKQKALSAGLFALTAAGLIYFLPLNPGILNLSIPTNIYKVDGAIPVICGTIHSDYEASTRYAEASSKLSGADTRTKKGAQLYADTLPKCVFPHPMEFQVRQYDPGIRMTFERNERLYYEGNYSTGINYRKNKRFKRKALILDAMYARDESVTSEDFQNAMEKTGTEYLVVETLRANAGFLKAAGCTLVTQEAGYDLYRYDGTSVT